MVIYGNVEFTLAASSGKLNKTVWRPSVRLSVCLTRLRMLTVTHQRAARARPAYVSVRVLRRRTYLLHS